MHDQPWIVTNAASNVPVPRSDNTCLPTQLVDSLPACAINCVQQFVRSHYQTDDCSSTSKLSNLCTQSNTSGLTIGEGSVQCIVSNCSSIDLKLTGAYNICQGISGALPNRATVIVATVAASTMASPTTSSDLNLLPTSIGEPDATQQITSLVMATGAPSASAPNPSAVTTQASSTSESSSVPFATATSSRTSSGSSSMTSNKAASIPDQAAAKPGLDSSQVVGIALGVSAVALITLAFIFFLCRHRRKAGTTKAKRRSMYDQQTPPPNYDGPAPGNNGLLAPLSRNSNNLSVHDPNSRYYAGVSEEKRRSFWRRSIKPEDIGVAVSPKANEHDSPSSVASHQSMLKLLPKVPKKLPVQSPWLAPINLINRRIPTGYTERPVSDATVFDEDIEALAETGADILVEGTHFSLAPPPRARLSRPHAATLRLNAVATEAPDLSPTTRRSTARIPLTPTYDNGNVNGSFGGRNPPSESKVDPPVYTPPNIQGSFLLEDNDKDAPSASRNLLRKRSMARVPVKTTFNSSPTFVSALKPGPSRKDSETTAATDIEERSTPGEVDRRLELPDSTAAMVSLNPSNGLPASLRSPISGLRYPNIPRSAAVSRQAEHIPRARASVVGTALPKPLWPTRDALVRNEASFMVTDTTSSDGYLSDQSIDWPVPPATQNSTRKAWSANQRAFESNVSRLRENTNGANRGFRPGETSSLAQVVNTIPRSELVLRSRPTAPAPSDPEPGKAGDLYFTVEM